MLSLLKDDLKKHVFFKNKNGVLLCCDCVRVLGLFPDKSVDLVVTSPPYDNLRNYDVDNLEEVWSFKKFKVFAERLYNVLKDGGVVVWVVGDETVDGDETGNSFRQALFFKKVGFKLHDTMIYGKNSFRYPEKTRYYQIFEYMFVFSKGKPKTFNLLKDRENKKKGFRHLYFGERKRNGDIVCKQKTVKVEKYSIRGNIWFYDIGFNLTSKDKISFKHPATFPEQLAIDHIKSWSNPGDVVLDPFAGSGTTLKSANFLGRNWIGIEINKKYCEIAKKRLISLLDF